MRPLTVVCAVASVSAVLAAARADLNVVIANGDVIRGTLLPASETETWRVSCPKGALLSAQLRSGPSRSALVLRVFDASDALLASAGGRSARIAKLAIATSGEQRVVVTSKDGVTSDDYRLAVSWTSPRRAKQTIAVGANTVGAFEFSCDAGADVALKLAPARLSAALPSLVRITGSHGGHTELAGGTTATFHATHADTYSLTFENTAAAAGDVVATAKIRPPVAARRQLSATARDIPPGTTIVAASVMDQTGGELDAPPASVLAGTRLTVPSNALTGPAIVVLGAVSDITPPKPADSIAATPAAVVGPFLREFHGDAKPTIDLSYAAVPAAPYGSGLRVFAADDPAVAQEVGPPNIVPAETRVGVEVTKFTRFQAFYVKEPDVTPPFVLHGTGAEELGSSVAVAGNFVYAGAPGAAGPGGEASAGAIRVFEHVASTWIERATLHDPSPVAGDRFGEHFTVRPGTDGALRLFAPVPKKTLSAIPELGVVHVFVGSGAAWTLEADVSPPVAADALGTWGRFANGGNLTVSTDGDRFVADGQLRYQDSPGGPWQFASGSSIYECVRNAGSWTIVDHAYGYMPAAIQGSTWFVKSAEGDPASGVPYNDVIYVQTRSGTTLTTTQTLVETVPAHAGIDGFGLCVAVEGDTLVTGAMAYDADAASTLALHTSVGHGRMYFGSRDPSGWTLGTEIEATFVPGGGITPYDGIGRANCVALSGDTAVAAAGQQPRARVYRRVAGQWSEAFQLDPTADTGTNHASTGVAIDGAVVVIGGGAGSEVYPVTDYTGVIAIYVLQP
jgi:hypothetical protein